MYIVLRTNGLSFRNHAARVRDTYLKQIMLRKYFKKVKKLVTSDKVFK